MHSQRHYSTALTSLLLMLLLLLPLGARATVLEQLDFDALVAQSPLIFTGTVTGWRIDTSDGMDHTYVTFRIEDLIKGSAPSTLELRFLGADLQGVPLHVEGQFIPVPGTRGVFFVATVDNNQVNPLTGWHQGFFPLMQDGNGDDFLDMRQRPDFVVPGLEVDPLVSKMLGLGFSSEAIDDKVARAFLFPADDFRLAITDQSERGGAAP